ncbi:hypothetical protein [Virgibacillus salexigens]|uniref:DUF4352 domain-containing protein n=1 Tax=Virgibacillus massiliensis TaxID=1462526 RepID=A0A024QCB4_9BACI|nr:hypothetical protein [Virgibacillus massiliensis]CDQ39571.1 hypothetical protein BN990_01876 [Virgibacillus massiliensis]
MRKVVLVILFTLCLFLVACNNNGSAENDSTNGIEGNKTSETGDEKSEQEVEETSSDKDNKELNEVGDVVNEGLYSVELLKTKEINETLDHGPISLKVIDAKLIKMFDISDEMKVSLEQFFNEEISNDFTYIQLQYNAKNTSDDDITWHRLTNVVADKSEQVDGNDDFLSREFVYDIFAGVEVEYLGGYLMSSSDVNDVRLIFSPVHKNGSYDELSGKLEYNFSF